MNSGDPDRTQEIFAEAMQVSPNRRAAFLDQACADQPDRRSSVEGLLRALDDAGRDGFLTSPTSADSAGGTLAPPWPDLSGTIGPYRLLERLGEGGFGEVWTAEQTKPMRRTVALKILKPGMDSKEVLARFEIERQALALMDHPNVARVYDAGATDQGRPYFVMEHAAGLPLTDYCDAGRLRVRQRLELFVPICEAVQHAHTKGIIHRDLKPSNILVTLADGKPVPKVIDFGIAKATAAPLTDRTLHTEIGRLMGTPEYMSPEQAGTSGIDVDTRSDVYSLGVILYQLLTGTLPFEPHTLRKADHSSLVEIIREMEPPTPSGRLSTLGAEPVNRHNGATPQEIAVRRDTEFAALQRQVKGELDWIVMKCLEKDRARRYETANGLASDVQHFLSGEPVVAAPPSRLYRFRKFARRNRVALIATIAVAASLVTGLTLATYGFITARDERDQKVTALGKERQARELAEQRERQNEQVSDFQASMLSGIDVEAMGRGIKEHLREQVRAALERQYVGEFPDRRKRTPEEIEAELAAFDQRAESAQAVDVARRVMDEFVLARAADALEKEFADQPLVRAQLHLAIGRTYWKLGLYDAAEPHLRTALEIRQRELGDEHSDTLTSIHNMGFLLRAQGRLAEAEPYLRKALEGRRRVLGDEHPATLASINEMGLLLHDQGKHSEAEPYVREALEGYRRVLGDDDPDTLSSISNMGLLLEDQGKPAEAEPYCREALEGRRRVLGDEHPSTLISIDNMGSVLQAQGRLPEAEPYRREALDGFRRVLGDEHPDTLTAINNMGVLLKAQRKLAEAEPYHREALEGHRRVLGDEHPATLASINSLGDLLHYQGKLAEAELYYREALEGYRRVLGDDHPDTLISVNNMAYLLWDQGRLPEAASLFAEATQAARAGLEDHPITAVLEHHYASVLRELGRLDEALDLARTAVDRYRAHPDWSPREAAHARSVLARALRAAGRLAEAEPHYREALAGNRRVLGDEDPTTLSFIYAMGFLLVDLGRPAEAEPYFREALEGRRRVLGEEHPATLAAINEMAFVLQAQGKFAEAEPYYRGALEIRRRVLGDEHPATLTSIHNMGYWLSAQGKPAEAEPYYREALETGRRVMGDDHRELFASIHAMGSVLRAQGKLVEAEPYFRDVLEKCRRVLGDKHQNTLRSLNSMGGLLQDQRKPAEAEAYFREALETSRRVLGDKHPITLTSINSMGMLLRDLGRLSEAESLFADGTRAARAGLGDHPTTGAIEHHYADVLREAGRVDEAIDLAQTAVDRYRAHPDWPPDEAACARRVLAEALLDVGDQALLEQAEEAARKSLEIRRTVLPEDHPRVWLRYNAMSMLGEVLVARAADPSAAIGARIEKLREAEPLLLLAWENLKDDPNVPPPSATGGISRTRSALERIVRLYDEWHAAEPDAGYEAKAAAWRTELEKLDGS